MDGSPQPTQLGGAFVGTVEIFLEDLDIGFAILGTDNEFHGTNTFIGPLVIRDTDDDLQLQGPNPTIAFVADTDADGDTSSEIKFYTGMSLETDPDYQAGIEATPTGNLIFRAGGDSDTNKIRIRPGGQVTFSRGTQDADSDTQ